MNLKKILAGFSAVALAVTSLSVVAFAEAETEDVSSNSQFMLKLTSYTVDGDGNVTTTANYDGAYAGNSTAEALTLKGTNILEGTPATNKNLTFSYNVGPISTTGIEDGDVWSVTVEGLTIKKGETAIFEDQTKTWNTTFHANEWGGYWDEDQPLTITGYETIADFKDESADPIVATWTSITVTTPKASEGGGSEGGGDVPAAQTATLTLNSWNDGTNDYYNYQTAIPFLTGLSASDLRKLDDFNITITVTDVACAGGASVTAADIHFNPHATNSDGAWINPDYANGAQGSATIAFKKSYFQSAAVTGLAGDKKLQLSVSTDGSTTALTGTVTITYTISGIPTIPADGEGGGSSSGSGSSGGSHLVAAPSTTEATETKPEEVVTAANGETVEAPKDVIPAGAALEVKEQTKEEAVKAVEAVKATEENKEVVETVKKAVEDGKAAVVEIDLVKDGAKVQPNGTIKVTVNVPAALKDAAKVFVYRVEADGTFTDVKAELKDGKVTFSTKHFSTYIFTAEPLEGAAVTAEAEAPANNEDKNQNTGVMIAVIPAALAASAVVIAKKKREE